MLDLKVFVHLGEYVEQDIGGSLEPQGADVILANLQLENTVTETTGLRGYALIIRAAIDAMDGSHLTGAMTGHTETYEHFPEVEMLIWDLGAEWEMERLRERTEHTPEESWVVESLDVSVPQWMAWDVATDTDMKRVYYDMESVSRVDLLGGPVREGSQYHCVHELGNVRFTITDWNPPHSFDSDEVALGIPVHFTVQSLPTEGGSTLRIMYQEPKTDDIEEVEPLFRQAARDALSRLAGPLEERAAS